MDAERFLILIRCIQKRMAETNLMKAHIASMANANKEAWDNYRISLGFEPELSDIEKAAKAKGATNLSKLAGLKTFLADS